MERVQEIPCREVLGEEFLQGTLVCPGGKESLLVGGERKGDLEQGSVWSVQRKGVLQHFRVDTNDDLHYKVLSLC